MKNDTINENSLFIILNKFENLFIDCCTYQEFRQKFLNLYFNFNEYYLGNDFKNKNLVYPLKTHFDKGLSLFVSYNEPDDFDLKIYNFIMLSKNISNFWYKVVIDYRYLNYGPNIFYVTYCYLLKMMLGLETLTKIARTNFLFDDEDGLITIKSIHILYCVFYSDKKISNLMNDNLYMYIEDLFEKFWKIFYKINPLNCCETYFKLNRLKEISKKRFDEFIEKYPYIHFYYRQDADSAFEHED